MYRVYVNQIFVGLINLSEKQVFKLKKDKEVKIVKIN